MNTKKKAAAKQGQAQVVEAYAEIGCAYGPVGNSCPSIFKNPDGEGYVIAAVDSDEHPEFGKSLAGIITDLWAYSIVDYDNFLAHGGSDEQIDQWHLDVVTVEPGTYKFVHHTGEDGFDGEDWESPTIYAHFEKVA